MKYNLNRPLNKDELKCLKLIHKGKLNCYDEKMCKRIDSFFMHSFVTCSIDMEGNLNYATAKLTDEGLYYLEKSLTDKKHYLFNEIRSWLAIFISICALIISIFYKR